jgi:putative peptidoglycan lipid II flippase
MQAGTEPTSAREDTTRFALVFAGGTFLSRIVGLVRDVTLGALIPTQLLGMFFFAFRFPNMLREMLGEGAVNAAFVPVFSEQQLRRSPEEYRRLVANVFGVMTLLFFGLVIVGVMVMPLTPPFLRAVESITGRLEHTHEGLAETVRMMQWTFPYIFFIGLTAFAMAPLFVQRHYFTPSWSPVLLNIALIGACVGLRFFFDNPAWALVVGVWLGGIAQLAVMWRALYRYVGVGLPMFSLGDPSIRTIFLLLFPVILGQAAGEVNKVVDSFFAYSLGAPVVAALFYANRLVQMPLSLFGVAVSVAVLPSLSRAVAQSDDARFRGLLLTGFRQSAFLMVPATVVMTLFSEPLIQALFEHGVFQHEDTVRTARALAVYSLGLLAFAWVKIAVQGFYAEQHTRTPVIVSSGAMLLNLGLNILFVKPFGYVGLCAATSLSYVANFVVLYILLSGRRGILLDRPFLVMFGKVLGAACGVGLWLGLCRYLWHFAAWREWFQILPLRGAEQLAEIFFVTTALSIAAALYLALSSALGIPDARRFLPWQRSAA